MLAGGWLKLAEKGCFVVFLFCDNFKTQSLNPECHIYGLAVGRRCLRQKPQPVNV